MPVSTIHVIASSILGVGASKRMSAVCWGVAYQMMAAWIFTLPAAGGVAALAYTGLHLFGME